MTRPLDPVHFFEDFFSLDVYPDPDFFTDFLEVFAHFGERLHGAGEIDDHHHVEITARDGLRDVEYVAAVLRQVGADFCYDADSVLAYDGYNDFFHVLLSPVLTDMSLVRKSLKDDSLPRQIAVRDRDPEI